MALALGVLALHQLSHGRSLVATDSAVAGHHAVVEAAPMPASDAHQVCDEVCQHAPTVIVCLLALVLMVGRWVLRAPRESWWFSWAGRVGSGSAGRVMARLRVVFARPVSPLSLGISRT